MQQEMHRRGTGRVAQGYLGQIELARRAARESAWAQALAEVRKAIAIDPTRPEAYNLLGAFEEILGEVDAAERSYRVACDLEPGYEPAQHNLARLAHPAGPAGDIWLA